MRKNNQASKSVRYYWRHVRQFPHLFYPAAFMLPLNVIVNNYIPPLLLATIINRLSTHAYVQHQVWSSFGGNIVLYLLVSLAGGTLLWRLFDMFYWRLEGNVERSISKEVFAYLIHQSADFHANQFAGSLVSDSNKITSSYVRLADTTSFTVMPLVVGLIFVTIIMFHRSPLYTGVLLLFSVVYIIISFVVTASVRQKSAALAAAESRQTGMLADAISNVLAIKSFARETHENKRFSRATDTSYKKLLGMMHAFQKQHIFLSSINSIMSWAALLAAIISVVSFGDNLSTAFLIFSYTSSITGQLFQFSNNALRNYNRAFGDASEMIDILALPPEVSDPVTPEPPKIHAGAIDFNHVTFTHAGATDSIFTDFNIHIQSGEKIGLVGHSGSGKSTFTRLLLRFSDIDSGTITIDGQNIAAITQAALHEAIAYVPQEPLLFHRSIAENIAYGLPQGTDDAITKAAQHAHASEFIDALPNKYNTLVGERGVKLSGGQRQRIAIARAMLKNAPILLLDEATSALDSESEIFIQDALWKLMEGRTAIVIAHRLSTIQKMDRIIVLESGHIAEEGAHKELISRKNGTYAKLWGHQSGGFLND